MRYIVLITHNGIFHADDVFSTAFMKYWIERKGYELHEIMRVSDVKEEVTELPGYVTPIIYDIGDGEFDHHTTQEYRENGVPYAAFGLLWRRYAPEIFGYNFVRRFDKEFVQPIDAQDNGMLSNPLSMTIKAMNPCWNEEPNFDQSFDEAVTFADICLRAHFKRRMANQQAEEEMHKYIRKIKNGVVILDHYIPPVLLCGMKNAIFMVAPGNRGGWSLNCIKIDGSGRRNGCRYKQLLPREWIDEKPPGCKFIHRSRFVAIFETKEDAVNAAYELQG